MPYSTGVATSQEDLMGQLATFAVANGWTQDIYSTTDDWLALHFGTIFVQFRWDNSTGIAMFQSLGFTGTGTAPGNQTGDSGNGLLDASAPYNSTVSSGRRINVGNGPYVAHHFFTDSSSSPTYIHVVLEYSAGLYRHFSFGTLQGKVGSWTGGEYAVHMKWVSGAESDVPTSSAGTAGHQFLWDGIYTGSTTGDAGEAGTIHIEGLGGQPGGSKWALFTFQTSTLGNDRAGNARFSVVGGTRGGPFLHSLGWLRANLLNGYIPLIPIPVWKRDTSVSPVQVMLLGYAPDARHIQMANINPGQEFSVGSDVWKCFPAARKQFLQADTEESRNMGIAYKKTP